MGKRAEYREAVLRHMTNQIKKRMRSGNKLLWLKVPEGPQEVIGAIRALAARDQITLLGGKWMIITDLIRWSDWPPVPERRQYVPR